MQQKHITLLALLLLISLIPIWRSGLRENQSFWEFVLNHTIWGPPVEYIPEEAYEDNLRR